MTGRNCHEDGGIRLKLYRLYHIDETGGIEAVSIIEAADSAEATNLAEALLQTSSGELWLENQMVSAVRPRDG